MKLLFTTFLTLIVTHFSYGQVTDSDIVRLTLGRKYGQLHKTLDSLGVWYTLHLDNDKLKDKRGVVDNKKMYSIEDGDGTVKVWAYIVDQVTRDVVEIVINYRHDSRAQIEDSRRLRNFTAFHVGLYSTDFVYMVKK